MTTTRTKTTRASRGTEMIYDCWWGGTADYPSYDGFLKGQDVAKQQMQQQNAMQKQAFDTQQQIISQLRQVTQPYTTAQGQGFTPEQYAAMQSQNMGQNAQYFNQAGQAVRSALAARGSGGGQLPVGGDYVRGISGLMGAQASDLAQNQNSLRIQNALQALTNKFNSMNLLSGNAATLTGTQGVSAAAGSNALNQYMTAANSGFGASFMKSFGGALGGGIGSAITGGVGNTLSRIPGFG